MGIELREVRENMNITGRCTSSQTFENRSDLALVHVLANDFSGSFNCKIENVTLDGDTPVMASEIAAFIESRHVSATLIGVDNTTGGTGSRACEKIELETILE